MDKESKIAVLGDPHLCAILKEALRSEGFKALDEGELEICDEWQVKRWMQQENPTHVFMCVGLQGQTSIHTFMFTLVGSANVLVGAAGIARRVRLVSIMPTVEYSLMRRLCELYFFDKGLDYADILYSVREKTEGYLRRCVLSMRDIPAKEMHASRGQSQKQSRQVPLQVVPQCEGGKAQHVSQSDRQSDSLREPAQPLLEVPGKDVKGAPSGDVCSQCDPGAGEEAAHPVHHHPGPVSGVVS